MQSLHLVTTDARRGAETFAVNLAESLNAVGQDAKIVAMSPSGTPVPHSMPALGTQRRAPGTLRALRCAASSADVVVAHGSSTLEACAVGLFGSGIPFVYRTIGDPSYWVTTTLRHRWVGMMLRRADRHVVLWSGAAEQLAVRYGIRPQAIDVIPNAVPADAFEFADEGARNQARERLGIERDRQCLAFVGALSPEKDVGVAIHAAAEIEDVILLVAGDGPERSHLERQAAHEAPRRVKFLGPVTNPADIYAAADVLLLPSRSEGMPGVLIEAALVGTPTVATAVGAVPEMLAETGGGYLVQPGDRSVFVEQVRKAVDRTEHVSRRDIAMAYRRYTLTNNVSRWIETLERATIP